MLLTLKSKVWYIREAGSFLGSYPNLVQTIFHGPFLMYTPRQGMISFNEEDLILVIYFNRLKDQMGLSSNN